MTDKDKSKDGLSQDDADLWREMTGDVKPLEGRNYQEGRVRPETAEAPKVEIVLPREAENPKQSMGTDVDRKTLRRFQRGEMPIEAEFDMHGMRQDEAHEALFRFIQGSYARGYRCVLVVTGKGNPNRAREDGMGEQSGVLKRRTPDWLQDASIRPLILQTHRATKHGGDGALYVLLRRKREASIQPEPGV